MRRQDLADLIAALSLPEGTCLNIKQLQKRFPGYLNLSIHLLFQTAGNPTFLFRRISNDTIISIYAQEVQHKVIKTNHIHKPLIEGYCARYRDGEDILAISTSIDFPPCMLMRRMLESMLHVQKQVIGDVLKAPRLLESPQVVTAEVPPGLLQRLQRDIVRCVHTDCVFSPYSDVAKQAAGLEHELLLADRLQHLNVPFWTEADLRTLGYYKTPDVRLQVPIAVRDPRHDTWRVVTWIDSKATFGDDRTHYKQLEEQYSTYVNRYGPGLVIYWFDFVDDIDSNDQGVMVLGTFPEAADVMALPHL